MVLQCFTGLEDNKCILVILSGNLFDTSIFHLQAQLRNELHSYLKVSVCSAVREITCGGIASRLTEVSVIC